MAMDEIFDIFREEAREHLGALETSFLDLESASSVETRRSLIDHAFRHAHSMKSDAKVVGLPDLKVAAQQLEDILDDWRSDPDAVDSDAISRGLTQFDQVRAAYEACQGAVGTTEIADGTTESPAGESATNVEAPAAETKTEPDHKPTPASPKEESFTVRVPSDRLDRMLNLAGELQVSQQSARVIMAGVKTLGEQLESLRRLPVHEREELAARVEPLLDHVRRIQHGLRSRNGREELLVTSLEREIRQSRLLPLVMLTDSLRRTVRDLSQSLAKPLRLEAEVGSIMLDKAVIEALKDPLQHMVRNAADHGIEAAEERQAAGKEAEAVIRIVATQRGQVVRIRFSDDGQGIDFAGIRQRLIRTGERSRAEAELLSITSHYTPPRLPRARSPGGGSDLTSCRMPCAGCKGASHWNQVRPRARRLPLRCR